MTDLELERALLDLGEELDVPEAPDLAPAVLARLEPRRAWRPRRRLALAVALALLALLVATLAIPPARSALLRILHIGGERIEFVEELPSVPAQTDLEAVLGKRVSLEEARRVAGFHLRELAERPDRVYIDARGTVWLLYGTPEQVHLLVAETPGSFDRDLALKKLVGPGTQVEPVAIGSAPGVFLSGAPHVVLLLDANGNVVEESARLARNVLVWSEDGVAYRLEGDMSEKEALHIARPLH